MSDNSFEYKSQHGIFGFDFTLDNMKLLFAFQEKHVHLRRLSI